MMKEMKKVTVVVVTFNGRAWVEKCFGSLSTSAYPVTTIVVDNGSTDGTQEAIISGFPEVQVIQSETNLGFGAGNNLAIRKAMTDGADYVFLLNQDAWIETKTIEQLVTIANSQTDFGIISPVHFTGDGEFLDRRFLNHLQSGHRKMFKEMFSDERKPFYEVNFVNAAAWLINISCIRKVGLFDPIFYHYGEDGNFASRCHYFGFKTLLVMNSRIWHDRDARIEQSDKERKFNFEQLRTGWVGQMTDPYYSAWSDQYLKDLMVFVLRTLLASGSHRRSAISLFWKLYRKKKDIAAARARMLNGYTSYELKERS